MESLLEEEILQTNIHSLKICDCSFSDPRAKLVYPLCCNHYQSLTVPKWTLFYQSCSDAITLYLKIYQSMVVPTIILPHYPSQYWTSPPG